MSKQSSYSHRIVRAALPALALLAPAAFCSAQTTPQPSPTPATAGQRIMLRPEMIVNESAFGDAKLLVDEQDAIGDPAAGKGTVPTRPFFAGWTAWEYPVHVVIDLGAVYQLSQVYLYNPTGRNSLTLSTGTPTDWKSQDVMLDAWRQWQAFPVNATTRYLRVTLNQPASLPEIALYGPKKASVPATVSRPVRHATPATMDQFIGTNAFIDDPVDKLAESTGFVREYHNWSWDNEAPDHLTRFQPSGAAGGHSWFFDDYYGRLKASGVTVSPSVEDTSPVYFPKVDSASKPVATDADTEDPKSYAIHAAHMFQYAVRYGSNKSIPDSAIKLAPDQPHRVGLSSLHYIEDWNEPNKNWKGKEGYFSPYALAAMCSADRDGDQGRMGQGYGIRSADPHMQLVLGGLVGPSLPFLRAMKFWADTHRGGDFPADVINIHIYCNDGTAEQPFKTTGLSPEAGRLKEQIAEVAAWRDANVPDRELWVTEFGYDTNPKSPIHSPALGTASGEEVQAWWLLRSYLALAAAGVDRAAMFMFRDVNSNDAGVFATCGMVTEKGQWKPKPSYYYIATMRKRLAGMRFREEIPSGNKDVLIYRFEGTGGKSAYAAWCSTSEDKHVPGITLSLPSGKTAATRVDFVNGSLEGKESPLSLQQSKVTLDVSECPTLVMAP